MTITYYVKLTQVSIFLININTINKIKSKTSKDYNNINFKILKLIFIVYFNLCFIKSYFLDRIKYHIQIFMKYMNIYIAI